VRKLFKDVDMCFKPGRNGQWTAESDGNLSEMHQSRSAMCDDEQSISIAVNQSLPSVIDDKRVCSVPSVSLLVVTTANIQMKWLYDHLISDNSFACRLSWTTTSHHAASAAYDSHFLGDRL